MEMVYRNGFSAFGISILSVCVLGASVRLQNCTNRLCGQIVAIPVAMRYGVRVWLRFGKGVGHSLDVLSVSSMLSSPGVSWDNRFMVFGVATRAKCTPSRHGVSTMTRVWKWVVWSFASLAAGFWPNTDPDGQEFPA
eukprot:12427597-Alexandrium_andersonii.AAC.1